MMRWLCIHVLVVMSLILVGANASPDENSVSKVNPERRLGHSRQGSTIHDNVSHHGSTHGIPRHPPPIPNECSELYFDQTIDHFGPSPGTFRQRYFVGDRHYNNNQTGDGGPMFFYLGNEADVTLYVNHTGLMWEHAQDFGALVVFAEHRYYGQSRIDVPHQTTTEGDFPDDVVHHLRYLSADQALKDYVRLVEHLRTAYRMRETDAVIAFGGSYGGMLASWARMRYPHVWDGAIAASAPILAFEGLEDYVDPGFFHAGLAYDVSERGTGSGACEAGLRKAFVDKALSTLVPSRLRAGFRVCPDDPTPDAALADAIANWLNNALSYMAMGNFPYPSGYILNGDGVLPALPIQVACGFLASDDLVRPDRVEEWMAGLAAFAGVYYNHTKELSCFTISAPVNNESSIVDTLWDYQYCSQLFMVGGQGPDRYDVYWNEAWDGNATAARCRAEYGFVPDRRHVFETYGTPKDWARDASNLLWSQGEYDPWRGGGVEDRPSSDDSLVALTIPGGAHHLDLFFSHPDDPPGVVAARRRELEEIRRWIDEKQEQHEPLQEPPPNKGHGRAPVLRAVGNRSEHSPATTVG